ncbi:hypothetical protein KAU11_12555 [Candidatus Babeliales bacterium]|nr:hypothetical protein [Candidatus Babeliales bacterium]
MAKLMNMLLLIFVLECSLALFVGFDFPGSTFHTWLTTGESGGFKDYIDEILALSGAATIVIGTVWMKSDFLLFAGITSVFFGFGVASMSKFWTYMAGKGLLGAHGGDPWIAILFISPLIIMLVYVCLAFWRGRD